MSRNTMSPTEEREYADWILELRQQALYSKQKHANESWHKVAERVAHLFGVGDPDADLRVSASAESRG